MQNTVIKLIVTDFDGVILDSEQSKLKAYRDCFAYFPDHVDEFMEYHLSNPYIGRYEKFEYFYRNILKQEYFEKEKKWIADRFNGMVFKLVSASPVIPGAIDFLKTYSKVVPIWVVTGTPVKELSKVLTAVNIDGYFEKLYSTPPHKTVILSAILNETKFSPNETVFIGDTNNDQKAAEENKIPFIGIYSQEGFENSPLYIMKDFLDIHNILGITGQNQIELRI